MQQFDLSILGVALVVLAVMSVSLVVRMRTRRRERTDQIRIEDALKLAFNDEHVGATVHIGGLAHALGWSALIAESVVDRLVELGLAVRDRGALHLTDSGRERALRVLRSHRVWERYLSDRTSMQPDAWHDAAERREHELTDEETDRLARAMGNPAFDPHGDPIPSASGQIPPPRGMPLTELRPGDKAVVTHVEDEPADVYAEVVRAGLHPATIVQMLSSEKNEIRFRANGLEIELGKPAASSVTVWPAPGTHVPSHPVRLLSELSHGEMARVAGVSYACPGPQRRRLLDLGFVPGTEVRAELQSPSGHIFAYRIRGALIALRGEQADYVYIDGNGAPQN